MDSHQRELCVWGDEVYSINDKTGFSIYKAKLGEAFGNTVNDDESRYINLFRW